MANVTFYFKDGTSAKTLKGYKIKFDDSTKDLYMLVNNTYKTLAKDKTA